MKFRPRWGPTVAAGAVSLVAFAELAALGVLVRDDTRRGQEAEIRAEFAVVNEAQALLPMVSTATIIERLSHEHGAGAHLLQQRDGRRIAGDLVALPTLRPVSGGFLSGRTPDGRTLIAARRVLDGGFPLLIGRRGGASVDEMTVALAVFIAAATVLLSLTGAVSRRGEARVLARVREIDIALGAVRAGDLSRRSPERAGTAPVDVLARHINSTLERLEELAHQHRSTGQFIAHELHRPLADACRELDSLASDAPPLVACRARLQRLSDAFDALVELSELRSDNAAERQPVRLDDLAREAVALYTPVAAARGLELSGDLGVAPVDGAQQELRVLVVNILDNAVKYTAEGAVRVSTGVDDGRAWLRVRDRGPGLAGFPTQPGRVFQRGPAARRGDGEEPSGLGLGLSLVQQVARRHGASLSWSDRQDGGGGAEVSVLFPAAGARDGS